MEENLFNRLVYMDHNVLDRMTKGEYLGFIGVFKNEGLIAAYSSESLNEIKRSVGFESSFLNDIWGQSKNSKENDRDGR